MSKAKFISFASVISEMKQSDMFMSVKMRILETPKANLNGVRVTEAFIDEIIADEERYVGLPLYADVKSLLSGKYGNLGHMYNSKTGEFYSTQIGSFYQFEKETFKGGAYLVGYARIPKRNQKLSKAIAELFADGSLKFSFEIACADYSEDEEGVLIIDASENNYLEGTAIVTFPACEDAVALEFVAQREGAGDTERGETEMAEVEKLENEEIVAEEQTEATQSEETAQPEMAEAQPEAVAEQETEAAETKVEETAETKEESEETAETEDASCKKKEEQAEEADKETAAVYVDTSKTVTETTYAYDSETGKSAFQRVEVTEGVSDSIEGSLVETEEGLRVAEAGDEGSTETPAETPTETPVETATETPVENTENQGDNVVQAVGDSVDETVPRLENDDEKKKTAEQMIAELTETVKALAEEVKSLKEQRVTAETEKLDVSAEMLNPFVDSMTTKADYYDLLQPVEKKNGYDLLKK